MSPSVKCDQYLNPAPAYRQGKKRCHVGGFHAEGRGARQGRVRRCHLSEGIIDPPQQHAAEIRDQDAMRKPFKELNV
jgi:hypothetical protein